jgi:hypothetical protein
LLLLQRLLQGLLLLPQLLQCCAGAAAQLRLACLELLQRLRGDLRRATQQQSQGRG